MSIPGTEEQKGCCSTARAVTRSSASCARPTIDEWTQVIVRMMGYGAVSQPIKPPQRMPKDPNRQGTPSNTKMADYSRPSI